MPKYSTEKIAHLIFIAVAIVAALIFGAFYLFRYHTPYLDNPEYNAPALTGWVIGFMLLLVLITALVTLWSVLRGLKRHETGDSNGIPVRRIAWATSLGTAALLGITFLCGSSKGLLINQKIFDDTFWLKTADMFIASSAILIVVALVLVVVSRIYAYNLRKKA